jgi:hypothetical protein
MCRPYGEYSLRRIKMKINESKKEIRIVNIIFDKHDVQLFNDFGIDIELIDIETREYGYSTIVENDDGTTEERRYNFVKKD